MPSRLCLLVGAFGALVVACDGAASGDAGPTPDAAIVQDAGSDAGPAHCVEASLDPLQDVTGTPAGPYFVHHPAMAARTTVLFIPGGPGTRSLASLTYDLFLSAPTTPDDVRILMPYSLTDFPSESARAIDVLDEAIECYGVDRSNVHLAGTSLGGLAAFGLMLIHADRFVTLMGVPGAFQTGTFDEQAAALDGKALFLGYGESDAPMWTDALDNLHSAMTTRGVDSRLEVFAGEGHVPSAAFDETIFFEFWRQPR